MALGATLVERRITLFRLERWVEPNWLIKSWMYDRSDSFLPNLPLEKGYIGLVLVLLLGILSIWASPFRYEDDGSGRYLLKVINAADPELLADDPVADSLKRFDSAFYDILASAFQIVPANPQIIEPAMFTFYIVYKIILLILIYFLAKNLISDFRFFILLALLTFFPNPVAVGGISLFSSILRHTEIAFLFCLLALIFLLIQKHYFLFWVSISLALLAHSLVAVHFLIVVLPVYLIGFRSDRPSYLVHFAGWIVFLGALTYYLFYMMPPPMSPEEGKLFLRMKGTFTHISLFNQSTFGWPKVLSLVGITLLIWWFYDKEDKNSRQLALMINWGILAAIILSLAALYTQSVRLALIQPMRIFFWVWFFTYLLFLIQAFKLIQARSVLGVLLIAAFFLILLQSMYGFVLLGFAGIYIIADCFLLKVRPNSALDLDKWTAAIMVVLMGILFIGWLVHRFWHLDYKFLSNLWPLYVLFLLGLIVWSGQIRPRLKQVLWSLVLVCVVLGASLFWHDYYAQRENSDWENVRIWARENSAKDDLFITTPDLGENFRVGSFRTSLTEPMSALAWVDPLLAQKNENDVQNVKSNFRDGKWYLKGLFEMARQRGARYVIVNGEYSAEIEPIFQSNEISVFMVEG